MSEDIDEFHNLTDQNKYAARMKELNERSVSPCKECNDQCPGIDRCDIFKAWHKLTWKMLHY
jgi:hypothetical protein